MEKESPKKLSSKHLKQHPTIGRLAVSLIQLLGRRSELWQHRASLCVGRLLYWLPNNTRHVSRVNIDLCYPQSLPDEKRQLLKDSLYYVVRQAMGMSFVWESKDASKESINNVYGIEQFTAAVENGDAVILAAPHLGNWELLNYYISNVHPGVGLYKEIRVKAVDDYVRNARESYGSKFLEATPKSIRELLRALKNGTPVYILPDQQPQKGNGVFAKLYDNSAYTMTLLSKLADKSNARVFGGFAMFTESGVDIHFIEGSEAIRGNGEASATALNELVEECIRHCPEQYAWSYKRFKRQPNGKKIY